MRAFYADHDGLEELKALQVDADRLAAQLLDQEMQMAEQMEATLDLYDTNLNDLRLGKLAEHQTFFRAMEQVEGKYFEAVQRLGEDLLKQASEDGANTEDLGDELASLLQERDSLLGAISGSHDAHVSVIIAREDALTAKENQRSKDALSSARAHEKTRNRERVQEIRQMQTRHHAIIREALDEVKDDDE